MSKTEIMNTVSRSFSMFGLKVKKHSPEILMVAGIASGVAATVMACKASTKVNTVLEKAKDEIEVINECGETGECMAEVDGEIVTIPYSAEDHKKDLSITYAKTGLEFAKMYGPAVALGVVSISCILASNGIMRKRNMALAAAYMTEHTSFKDYRGRLIERFGKELDRELKYNIKSKDVDEIVTDSEGNETVVKKTVETAQINENSEYARFFDEGCAGWTKDPEDNLYFLRQQEMWANDKLKADGYLFLNDVYKMIGIPVSKAGQQVGWIYDEKHPIGDNRVDFGIYDVHNERKRAFVNGYERSILLDFNVDGVILDYI